MTIIAIDVVRNIDRLTVRSRTDLDLAIMQELRDASNTNAQKLFNKNKKYEARIAGGLLNSRTYWQGLMLDEIVFKIQTGEIYERQEDLYQETAKLA